MHELNEPEKGKARGYYQCFWKIDFVARYLDKVPYTNNACLAIVSQKSMNC